jgi:hypothetical protein
LFDDLLSIPNYGDDPCNSADKTKNNYECSIIAKLEGHGFFKITIEELFNNQHSQFNETSCKKKKEYITAFSIFKNKLKFGTLKLCNFSVKAYIWQPFGSQQHPDFFIIDNSICQAFEAKSGKKNVVQFNSGIPDNENQIYIFATKIGVGSALAKRIFTPNVLSEIKTLEETFIEKIENCNHNLIKFKDTEQNRYGLSYYNRRMINHTRPVVGDNNKIDLEEVRNYIRGLYE